MNSDYSKKVCLNTASLSWETTEHLNVFKKVLSIDESKETALFKIEKGANLKKSTNVNSVEIFVIEGVYINEFGEFPQGSYLYLPKENEHFIESNAGCIIFRKSNYFTDEEKIIISTESSPWLPGQGNLEVMPLFGQTALVKWPKNERFIPHSHLGGEEILVLKGCFIDEYGKYPQGYWLRSPHLSKHFPYVEEETIIFVKTGHL